MIVLTWGYLLQIVVLTLAASGKPHKKKSFQVKKNDVSNLNLLMLCNFSVVPKPPCHWMETSSTENISGHTEPAKWLTEAALQSKCPKVLCRAWHKNHCCFDCLIWQAMWRAPVKQRRWLLPPVELKVSKSYLRLPRATHYSILNGMLKYWSITEFEEQARRKYNTANLCKTFSNV